MTERPVTARALRSDPRLRAKVAAIVAGAALLLTGCAAGQRAQTAVEVPVIDGVGADVGAINIRALTIAPPANGSYPSGGSASLQLFIVNNGSPDQLVSVSSPEAKSVSIYPTAAAAFTVPSTSASASSSSSSSAAAATSAPAAPVTVKLASGETTQIGLAAAQPQIVLSGLTAALYPATSIPLTFTFATAGTVTVWVAVHLSTGAVKAPTLPVTHETAG